MSTPDEIVERYGRDAWRYLGWSPDGLAAIARWKQSAVDIGLTVDQAEDLWAAVELEQMLGDRPFNALAEAQRRLEAMVTGG